MLDVSARWPGCRLLTLNLHTSVMSAEARGENLATLRQFLRDLLWKEYLENGMEALECTGVLVAGDLNIDPDLQPALYKWLLTLGGRAQLRDLFEPAENPLHPRRRRAARGQSGAMSDDELSLCCTLEGPWRSASDGSLRGNQLCKFDGVKARLDYLLSVDKFVFSHQDLGRAMGETANDGKCVGQRDGESLAQRVAREKDEDDRFIARVAAQVLTKQTLQRARQARALWRRGLGLEIRPLGLETRGVVVVRQDPGQELSDHWGLSGTLGVRAESARRVLELKRNKAKAEAEMGEGVSSLKKSDRLIELGGEDDTSDGSLDDEVGKGGANDKGVISGLPPHMRRNR